MSFYIEGANEFDRYLIKKAQELPKEAFRIMRIMGQEARKKAVKRSKTKSEIGSVTRNYQRSWKRGKAFRRKDGSFAIEVYNNSPHAHLIEDGHRIVGKKPEKKEYGFARGRKILDKSMREFQDNELESMLGAWLDEMLDKGL